MDDLTATQPPSLQYTGFCDRYGWSFVWAPGWVFTMHLHFLLHSFHPSLFYFQRELIGLHNVPGPKYNALKRNL
jgi:hypothetical protein